MGTCWKMMVDREWSVSISSFLFSATLLAWINMDVTAAQKISTDMLDNILGDIANQYQDADYGGMDYNDLMPEETPSMYKDAAEPRSLKQTHNSKGQIKNSMLPAYCDPPNPCPIGYTAEDGCIEMFENKQNSAGNTRPPKTACVTLSTCSAALMPRSPIFTRKNRTLISLTLASLMSRMSIILS